ncbi:hypothetical protein YTPLAS73_03010 [Nitrosarchaeum sp.]|nr:hypothetical protein YTPLAS73_03010 [Nitrosarchaeum sp.]
MDFEKLCTKALEIDPHVRFTGILDSKGELIIEKNRDNATLLNEEEVKMSIHYTFERWTRLQNLSYKFGKEKLSVTEYENVTLISIQLGKNLFLLSTDPNVNHMNIISKIKATIAELQ